jgi:hypothetical protein
MNLQAEIEDLEALRDEMKRISMHERTLKGKTLYCNRAEFFSDLIKRFKELILKERGKHAGKSEAV